MFFFEYCIMEMLKNNPQFQNIDNEIIITNIKKNEVEMSNWMGTPKPSQGIDYEAYKAGGKDEEDGADAAQGEEEDSSEKTETEEELEGEAGLAETVGREQLEGSGGNEPHHHFAQQGKDVVDVLVALGALQKDDGQEHEDDGQQDDGTGGQQGPEDGLPRLVARVEDSGVAGIGGGVDAHRAGSHLADGQYVGELLGGEPVVADGHLALNEGYHGIAPPEGEKPDFEE